MTSDAAMLRSCGTTIRRRCGRALGPQALQVVDDQVEALAVDELHGVVEVLAVLADVEDRHDVGVMHPRRGLRLALKADLRRGVARARPGQHLEGDAPAQGLLLGLVDDAHAAAADLAQDAVVADLLAGACRRRARSRRRNPRHRRGRA